MSAASASEFRTPLVIETSVGRRSRAASVCATLTGSALSPDWLTQITSVCSVSIGMRKCSSSAASIMKLWIPAPASVVTGA